MVNPIYELNDNVLKLTPFNVFLFSELERKFAEKYLDMKQEKEENSIENKLAITIFKLLIYI